MTARGGSVARPTQAADRRQLDFNADGTFKLTICEPAGQPLSPEQYAAGTWHLDDGTLVIKVKTASLDAAHARWAPEQCLELRLKSGGAERDSLDIRDAGGLRVRYGRDRPGPG